MSSVEGFKDKSKQEIMNWMIANLTPDQIASCTDESIGEPMAMPTQQGGVLDAGNLRTFCVNKKYVIHKIVGDVPKEGKPDTRTVYFWFYLVKSSKWLYSDAPITDFPTDALDENSEECGQDTLIEDNFKEDLTSAYNNYELSPNKKFNQLNTGESEKYAFHEAKEEYKKSDLNIEWVNQKQAWQETLLSALIIQENVPINDNRVYNYTPILIYDATSVNVKYYYLVNDDGDVRFQRGNLPLSKFRQDLMEINNDINLQILEKGKPGGSDSKTIDEWKLAIVVAAQEIDKNDLEEIKGIYSEFPLTKDGPYFIPGLFGNEFGKSNINRFNIKNEKMTNYVENNYGPITASKFGASVITNKFGASTVILHPK